MLVCFAHGKESGPWGSKITALAQVAKRMGFEVLTAQIREEKMGKERFAS
jgi:hypothetical protein